MPLKPDSYNSRNGGLEIWDNMLSGISARKIRMGASCCSLDLLSDLLFPQFCEWFRSNGAICQHSLGQPGSPQPSSQQAHPHRESRKQRFPHRDTWGGCHSPLPPEPKSSGFPVSPRALWSLMRYEAGFSTIFLSWVMHCLVLQPVESVWWAKVLNQPFGMTFLPSKVLAMGWGLSRWAWKFVWIDCEYLEGGNLLRVADSQSQVLNVDS